MQRSERSHGPPQTVASAAQHAPTPLVRELPAGRPLTAVRPVGAGSCCSSTHDAPTGHRLPSALRSCARDLHRRRRPSRARRGSPWHPLRGWRRRRCAPSPLHGHARCDLAGIAHSGVLSRPLTISSGRRRPRRSAWVKGGALTGIGTASQNDKLLALVRGRYLQADASGRSGSQGCSGRL